MSSPEIIALILAGGEGRRLDVLSEKRAKPAVPFGGKYRIIDFCLSNCVNSDIHCVGVLTQYNPRSLHDHIRIGKAWDLDRMVGGVFLLQPYVSDALTGWYRGTADAVYQNLRFIRDRSPSLVLVLSGDHIYKMDYREMLQFHYSHHADITLGGVEVSPEEVGRFGIITTDNEERVIKFEEKPPVSASYIASMGIYIFNTDILEEEMEREVIREGTRFDFGKDILPRLIKTRKVYACLFQGYWKDVGTLDAYWEANMDLLDEKFPLDLYDRSWPIRTPEEDRPPVKLGSTACVESSILGEGTIINGKVENSVLFNGVFVSEGALVRDSIVMNDVVVEAGAQVDRSILDKSVRVRENARIGWGEDKRENMKYPDVLRSGLNVVGKNTRIPPGLIIGRNCRIGADVKEYDFIQSFVNSGESIECRM